MTTFVGDWRQPLEATTHNHPRGAARHHPHAGRTAAAGGGAAPKVAFLCLTTVVLLSTLIPTDPVSLDSLITGAGDIVADLVISMFGTMPAFRLP